MIENNDNILNGGSPSAQGEQNPGNNPETGLDRNPAQQQDTGKDKAPVPRQEQEQDLDQLPEQVEEQEPEQNIVQTQNAEPGSEPEPAITQQQPIEEHPAEQDQPQTTGQGLAQTQQHSQEQTQNRGRGPAPFQNSNQNRNQNFPQGRARQQQQNAEPVPPPPTPVGKPIAIRFKPMGEFYFLYDEGLELKPREKVIVKISKGKDIAEVAMIEFPQEFKVTDPQLRILRRVNDADISQQERNAQREKEAFGICLSKIKKLELPMKLLAVKYIFDGSRITFYFKADSKVDFRKLVRELAAIFRTRIELRQIGPRDETELFGGLGVCGRRVCCTYWCCKAKPVINVDSPKTPFAGLQGMSNKALGLCSRPLCCLRYEGDAEPCCKIALPAVNSKIVIDEQNGVLKLIDIKANQVCIQIDGEEVELNISYEDFLLKLNEGKAKKI
ncbi:MAG TPA: hypothetical protein DC017_01695 [Candidatus Wallbacteria bacterium]|nr:hypothetical protein [Candidatus Wallbacteria bacterium]